MLFDLIDRQLTQNRINELAQQVKEFEDKAQEFEKSVASFGIGYKDAEGAVCSICKADKCVAEPCYRDQCAFYEPKLDSIADNPNSQTLIACTCKNCGGRLNTKTLVCEFCGTPYKAF